MKIFLSILLSYSFLNLFSQNDSIANKFTISFLPFSILTETGVCFEQSIKKISFEIGVGIPVYKPGYFLRLGMKKFRNPKILDEQQLNGKRYFEILAYYKRLTYTDREYYPDSNPILETDNFSRHIFNGGSERENNIVLVADELKHIFCLEFLFGRKVFVTKSNHWIIDYFFGVGIRYKYRVLTIKEAINGSMELSPLNPPRKGNIRTYLPALDFGCKLGYSF